MEERHARRILKRNGYSLIKSRAKNPTANNLCGYMVVYTDINGVCFGGNFDATLEDVISFVEEL